MSSRVVDQLLSKLGSAPAGEYSRDHAEYIKRAVQMYYDNEDQIIKETGLSSVLIYERISPTSLESSTAIDESDSDDEYSLQSTIGATKSFFSNDYDEVDFSLISSIEPTLSEDWLKKAEMKILSGIGSGLEAFDVHITEGVTVHTVCFKAELRGQTSKVPLVMIHGLGGSIPTFHKIYGPLAKDRCVYGIDLPGFALSSRMKFPNNAATCEDQMVNMIESWREKMKLEEIILLGHSFGGYVSAAYAIKHFRHVRHLFLVDPWGILSQQEDDDHESKNKTEVISRKLFGKFKANPYEVFHKLGCTVGNALLKTIMSKEARQLYGESCMDYFVLANTSGGSATGAKAFSVLSDYTFAYPKYPLKQRLLSLFKCDVYLPITFIYGNDSPFHNNGGLERSRRKPVTSLMWRLLMEQLITSMSKSLKRW